MAVRIMTGVRLVVAVAAAGGVISVFVGAMLEVRASSAAVACPTPFSVHPVAHTNRAPDPSLKAILSIARTPANGPGPSALGPVDQYPWRVQTIFSRYIRIVDGERHTRIAFFPATICNPNGSQTLTQAILMMVLSNPPPRPTILAGTAATITDGTALPGLDLPNQQGWIQAIVVPDGIAAVYMHFTPPFLHPYSAWLPIHDNIGIAVRKPDYTPTTVSWYAAGGRLLRTFTNRTGPP
jgi:hypothetical protein